jgi:hypothetical protein
MFRYALVFIFVPFEFVFSEKNECRMKTKKTDDFPFGLVFFRCPLYLVSDPVSDSFDSKSDLKLICKSENEKEFIPTYFFRHINTAHAKTYIPERTLIPIMDEIPMGLLGYSHNQLNLCVLKWIKV